MASVSLEGLNLARMHHHGASITASATASSLASSSPPSGHSTPKLDPRSPARDMERTGAMTLVTWAGNGGVSRRLAVADVCALPNSRAT